LTAALLTATAASPCTAARRPDRPPTTARKVAAEIQIRDLSAALDSRVMPWSSSGVGVSAIAA
jgi:hypothetical protein